MSARWLAPAVALLAAGCLLPDPYRLDAQVDAGSDAPADAPQDAPDASDAPHDAGPFCAPAVLHETQCTPGSGDEDCDGLADCNDFDCSTSLDCCGMGSPFLSEAFTGGVPASWGWMPSGQGSIPQPSGQLSDFGTTGLPRGVRVPLCLPADLGVRVLLDMQVDGMAPSCPAGISPCVNYAAAVLSPASDMAPGEPLLDELGVRLHSDGRAELRQAGSVVATAPAPFGAGVVRVTIELAPGVDASGIAYAFATVTLTQGPTGWVALDHAPFVPRDHLIGRPLGCTEALGLNLAFEGISNHVSIDNLAVRRFECANPGHFVAVDAIGSTVAGAGAADWTGGGAGSPGLVAFFPSSTSMVERWDLAYDASNRERTLEGASTVHYSIGGAIRSSGLAFSDGWTARSAGAPLLGYRPPDCDGSTIPMPPGDCALLRSWRDPSIYASVDETSRALVGGAMGSAWLSYARETMPGSRVHDLVVARLELADAPVGAERTMLAASATDCRSLRDPTLLPMQPAGEGDALLLLFTCDRGPGVPTTIGAATLADINATAVVSSTRALDPSTFGPFARAGLSSADAAVFFVGTAAAPETQRAVYRVWLMTRDFSRPTLSFVEGTAPWGQVPGFVPYGANPVLLPGDPILGTCPPRGCALDSVAVSRHANEPTVVRLLLARTLDEDTGIRHVLVPLDQHWPALLP